MHAKEINRVQDKDSYSDCIELIKSAEDEYLEDIQSYILANSGCTRKKDQFGRTILHHAAISGFLSLIKWLLDENLSSVNEKAPHGLDALLFAARNGHLKLVKYLLIKTDVDYYIGDDEGNTALLWAVLRGHIDVAQFLIKGDYFEINAANDEGVSALHFAAISGCSELIEIIVEAGAAIEVTDNEGDTPLHCAAIEGHEAIVQWLIDVAEADPWPYNVDRDTPLDEAVINGNLKILQLYAEKYLPLYPRIEAQAEGASDEAKKELFWKLKGESLLILATEYDQLEILIYLNEHCLFQEQELEEINFKMGLCASLNGSTEVLDHLIKTYGIDLERRDKKGNTALQLACKGGQLDLAICLIEQGADIHTCDIYGSSILHAAAYGGHWNIILYLLQYYKFDLATTTKKNETVLETVLYSSWIEDEKLKINHLYTAFNLVMLSCASEAQYAHLVLWTYNAYAQQNVYRLEKDILAITDADQKRKVNNIKKNYMYMLENTHILSNFIIRTYNLFYKYIFSISGPVNIISQLPQAILVNEILSSALASELRIRLNLRNNPIFTSWVKQIISQLKSIKHRCLNQKSRILPYALMSSTTYKEINAQWLSQIKCEHIDYPALYNDLLRWIEQLGKERINNYFPQQCSALFRYRTPLTAAIILGLEKLVEWLLKWGANPDSPDNKGEYPIHLACYNGHYEIINLLLAHGANKSFYNKNARGNYPLHEAIIGRHAFIVELLLEQCFDRAFLIGQQNLVGYKKLPTINIEQKNYELEAPIDLAWMTNQYDVLLLLINRGVEFSRFIDKAIPRKNRTYNMSQWGFFKFVPFARQISNGNLSGLQKNIYFEYQNLVANISNIDQDEDVFKAELINFNAIKYSIIRFVETLDEFLPFNTIVLSNLRNFLVHHSIQYLSENNTSENISTLYFLIKEFKDFILQGEMYAAIVAYCLPYLDREINIPRSILLLQKKIDKNLALHYIMQTIENSALYAEVVNVKANENDKMFETKLPLEEYLLILRGLLINLREISCSIFLSIAVPELSQVEYNASKICAAYSLVIDIYECIQRVKKLKLLKSGLAVLNEPERLIFKELFSIIMPLRNSLVHGLLLQESHKVDLLGEIYTNLLLLPAEETQAILEAITEDKIYEAVVSLCEANNQSEEKEKITNITSFSPFYRKKYDVHALSIEDNIKHPFSFPRP